MLEASQIFLSEFSWWLPEQCPNWASDLVVKYTQLFEFNLAHIYLVVRQCKIGRRCKLQLRKRYVTKDPRVQAVMPGNQLKAQFGTFWIIPTKILTHPLKMPVGARQVKWKVIFYLGTMNNRLKGTKRGRGMRRWYRLILSYLWILRKDFFPWEYTYNKTTMVWTPQKGDAHCCYFTVKCIYRDRKLGMCRGMQRRRSNVRSRDLAAYCCVCTLASLRCTAKMWGTSQDLHLRPFKQPLILHCT